MNGGWKSWDDNGRSHNGGRPPLPPGSWYSSVPQWEKKFCTSVCKVPWGKICAYQGIVAGYKNVADWDDSGALEAFENSKARYWADINGLMCDISFPDQDFYMDEVDFEAVIDPELVEDLEKRPPPPPDRIDYAKLPIVPTGWGDAEDDNKAEHRSAHGTNWDAFLDKQSTPVQATGWGEAEFNQPINANTCNTWNHNDDWEGGTVQATGWGDPVFNQPTNADSRHAWKRNAGWGDGNVQDCSRGGGEYNSGNNLRDTSWGHSDNWNNNEQGGRNSRKRNGSNYGSRFSKSRHQMSNYQTKSSNWRDCRERNATDSHYEKTMRAGQPMAVRQWKSKPSCEPVNHNNPAECGGAWSWKKSTI